MSAADMSAWEPSTVDLWALEALQKTETSPLNEFSNDARNHEAGDNVGGHVDGEGGCFNCGQEGHMKSECPESRKEGENSGLCYNCGQEGHNKSDCRNEAVAGAFDGMCRLCDEQGHRAADCPTAPPHACKNCFEEGHSINDCKNARKIDRSDVEDKDPEISWDDMAKAVEECDLDDFKIALPKYLKSCPKLTYVELEQAFRTQDIPVYIIALEREMTETYTNMDLQGGLGKKYTVSYRFSDKPKRPKEKDGWPSSEENLERLTDAGEAVDVRMPKCSNCDALGHISKSCTEEKNEVTDRAQVMCYNCEEVGHRVRDCPNERPDRFACRNCGKSGHSSKECTEPRDESTMTCRKCEEVGHSSRTCPLGGGGSFACRNCNQEGHKAADCTNERVLICRNCDAEGHLSKECKEKKDWMRVKCSNCQQMGHGKARCTEPLKEEDDGGYGGGGAAESGGGGGGGADGFPIQTSNADGW